MTEYEKKSHSRGQEFVLMALLFLLAIPFVYLLGFLSALVVWLFVEGWNGVW